MDTIKKARDLLVAAETGLRMLMEDALNAGRYSDVARLAEIATALGGAIKCAAGESASRAGLAHQSALTSLDAPNSVDTDASTQSAVGDAKPSKPTNVQVYPKFETDGDRLVKIGWSKKARAIYEHRTPRDVAEAVSLYLASSANGNLFKMDDLLPIELADGSEVPLYQAYLVLAWLRSSGLMDKKGKDGYQWTIASFGEGDFASAWKSTANRS